MKSNLKLKILLFLSLLLLLPQFSIADGLNVIEVPGNMVIPLENHEIQMVNEEVRITPAQGTDYPMKVECNFIFKNHSAKKINIDMGFPIHENKLNEETFGIRRPLVFAKVLIDKKITTFSKKELKKDAWLNLGKEYIGAYVWPVSFDPMEQKVVTVEYVMEWGHYWRDYDPLQIKVFKYVTKTGTLWKGLIERADFYLAIPDSFVNIPKVFWANPERQPKIYWDIVPKGIWVDNKTIEWHFKNWKPDKDIIVKQYMYEPFSDNDYRLVEMIKEIMPKKEKYDGNLKKYTIKDIKQDLPSYKKFGKKFPFLNNDNKKYQKFIVLALKNEIYARHGKIFKDEIISKFFEYSDWYKPNPKYTDNMLNDIEKKNILFLERYEKQFAESKLIK